MAERVGKSQADVLSVADQLIAGFSKKESDSKYASYAKELSATSNDVRSKDERQEKAKAELYTASKEVKESVKRLRTVVSRSISFLESELGKSSPELQAFGIPRRQSTARKTAPTPKKEK